MGMNLLESSLRRYLARFERSDVVKKIQKLFSGVTIAGLPACQWVKLSVVAGMVIVPWAAFAAPANDDFANAISITDMVGSVSSTNNSATLESGEPDFINADDFASVDNSVWYQWTAPSNGVVAFDTFGSGFDTVLAVYTNSFSDPIVAGNDDYILGIIPQSYVTFAVQAGTTYYISVNGNPYPVAGYTDAGNFVLNWKETVPTIPSGTFQFTSASYVASDHESVQPYNVPMALVPSFPGARATVTRVGGSSGRVLVPYTIVGDATQTDPGANTNGILVFDDYQMSADIAVPTTSMPATNGISGTNSVVYAPPASISVALGTPILDSAESSDLMPPQVGPLANATIEVLSRDYGASETDPAAFGIPFFNIERSTLRCKESQGNAIVYVYPSVAPPSGHTYTVQYAIDKIVSFTDIIRDYDTFPLQAGSDYATPDQDFTDVSGGVLSWGPNDATPKAISIPIIDDTNAEFNEDMEIELFNPRDGSAFLALGQVDKATLTVLTDDQPAGAVDKTWNRDGVNASNPQFLRYPGTQGGVSDSANGNGGTVYAAVEQPDGNSVIAGSFISYDSKAYNRIVRLLTNGYPDTTFLASPNSGANDSIYAMVRQPDGKLIIGGNFTSFNGINRYHIARLNTNGTVDATFNPGLGANDKIWALGLQSDGKILIGGDFTSYNGTGCNYFARLNVDGSFDSQFDLTNQLNGPVYAIAGPPVTPININRADAGTGQEDDNSVKLGSSVAGTLTLDYDFSSAANDLRVFYGGTDTNAGTGVLIYDTGVAFGTGHLVIPFGPTNGFTTNSITIVMNQGGAQPGSAWSYTAQILTPESAQVYVGGAFTQVGGDYYGGVARFDGDGSVDSSFSPGIGTYNPDTADTDPIRSLALQGDGKLLAGGSFSYVQMTRFNGLARFNTDGTVDTSFGTIGSINGTYNPVTGTADTVNAITVQPDGAVLIGGDFTTINQTRRVGIARLYADGSLDTTFMDTAYNQFAGLINHYHNADAVNTNDYPQGNHRNAVYAIALETGGNVIIGGNFLRVGGGSFGHAAANSIQQPADGIYPVDQADEHGIIYNGRMDIHPRSNVARLIGGATPGPGNLTFVEKDYSVDKNGGSLFISLVRTNGSLGDVGASFGVLPAADGQQGVAVLGTDFDYDNSQPEWLSTWNNDVPAAYGWMVSDAFFGPNYNIFSAGNAASETLTIHNNTLLAGNLNANLGLSQPNGTDLLYLGGENMPLGVALGAQQTAPLTIIDDNFPPGTFSFSQSAYTVNAKSNSVVITVTRTNGTTGTVQLNYATFDGTAVAPTNYTSVSGVLTFVDGVASQTFTVPIAPVTTSQPDRTVNLKLFGITGGGKPGVTNAVLTIVNSVYTGGHIAFAFATNTVAENVGTAGVMLNRLGGSSGTVDVTLVAGGGTAVNGVNYVAITNIVHWNDGDASPKTVNVPVLHDGIYTSNLTANLTLSDGMANGKANGNVLGLSVVTNSVLLINNVDFPGQVEFTSASYSVKKYGGYALIPVVRTGGSAGTLTVNYSTINGSALSGVNYGTSSGVLTFTNGEVSQYFRVSITNGVNNGLLSLGLVLSNATVQGSSLTWNALGTPSNAVLNIIDTDSVDETPGSIDATYSQFAGFNGNVFALALQTNNYLVAGGDFTMANGIPRQRIARLNPNGVLDTSFSLPSSSMGADGQVRALAIQADGRIIVAGAFTNFNSVSLNRIARLNYDGMLDSSFNPGSGADNPIYAVAQSPVDAKIYVGGAFGRLDGAIYNSIGRLNADGSPDTTFNSGGLGANGTVYALAVQTDGKVVIGGDFTAVNGVACNHLARLNTDGSLDSSFKPGTGANDSVRAVAIQLDGRIVIGGQFTDYDGVSFIRVGRVNADGSPDTSFTPGAGANDIVSCIAIQTDNRIVIGGQFTRCSGVFRNHLTRLNPDGTVDPTINFGTGANDYVAAVAVQESSIAGYPADVPDEKLIIGGVFNEFNGQTRNHLARIFGGSVSGSGAFQFSMPDYQINENSTNPAVITVIRTGGTSGTNADGSGSVLVSFTTSNLTAVAGVNYSAVATNISFPMGEVMQTVGVPVMDDAVITSNLTVRLALEAQAPAVNGNQPDATLTIANVDSAVAFSSTTYQVPKNVVNGAALINILRQGSASGSASVIFNTTTNGTAVPGVDYTPVTNALVTFSPGVTNVTVAVPIINNDLPEGPTTVTMQLTNASNAALYAPSNATLTIIDTVYAPGVLSFDSTNVAAMEGNTNIYLNVIRANGSSGIISVSYKTVPGTAQPGVNYQSVTGTISLGDGVTNKLIPISLLENGIVQGTVNFGVNLFNPTGGATLANPTNTTVTVFDNDSGIAFTLATNSAPESNALIPINVQRIGNTNNAVSVNYATSDGTAHAGVNYLAASGSLTFAAGESQKVVTVPLLHDTNATGDLTFNLGLFNPSSNAQVSFPSNTVVVAQDVEAGLSFSTNAQSVLKNVGYAVVTVVCANPRVEPVVASSNDVPLQVSYTTADGTAIAGQDYTAVSGTLVFTNGMVTNTFAVPILNNSFVNGDKSFTASLSSPTAPGQVTTPGIQTIVIRDSNTGFRFSQPEYSVFKDGVTATITVWRNGYTNNVASVNYTATNGTAVNGVNFIATSGTLVFTNGVTSKSFNVSILGNNIVQPDLTVLLQLSNPTNGILVSPSAATLDILENGGSYVIPAGAQLVTNYTSQLTDNIIYSNATVQVLFAFRAAAGLNVTNLVAHLLPGNGVNTPSPASQAYGPLTVHGHSVSRPFTFTATGTNGGNVFPTFALYDNGTPIGTNRFTFTLGTWTTSFSNTAAITINDNTSASPYPSVINVSGIGGSVVKTRVKLNNLTHTSPSDIDALVVSPSGADTLIMAHAGGALSVTNIVLTFDDAATNSLPSSSRLTTSTNKPTQYLPVQNFP
jgi:uncharacterized delta-60 repeat protein